jgi:hypothetical protein
MDGPATREYFFEAEVYRQPGAVSSPFLPVPGIRAGPPFKKDLSSLTGLSIKKSKRT